VPVDRRSSDDPESKRSRVDGNGVDVNKVLNATGEMNAKPMEEVVVGDSADGDYISSGTGAVSDTGVAGDEASNKMDSDVNTAIHLDAPAGSSADSDGFETKGASATAAWYSSFNTATAGRSEDEEIEVDYDELIEDEDDDGLILDGSFEAARPQGDTSLTANENSNSLIRILVEGLADDISERMMQDKFGAAVSVKIYPSKDRTAKAVVRLKSASQLKKSLTFNGTKWVVRNCLQKPLRPRVYDISSCKTVMVAGFKVRPVVDDVKVLFASCGAVEKVDVEVSGKESVRVVFRDLESLEAALELDGSTSRIDGVVLKVECDIVKDIVKDITPRTPNTPGSSRPQRVRSIGGGEGKGPLVTATGHHSDRREEPNGNSSAAYRGREGNNNHSFQGGASRTGQPYPSAGGSVQPQSARQSHDRRERGRSSDSGRGRGRDAALSASVTTSSGISINFGSNSRDTHDSNAGAGSFYNNSGSHNNKRKLDNEYHAELPAGKNLRYQSSYDSQSNYHGLYAPNDIQNNYHNQYAPNVNTYASSTANYPVNNHRHMDHNQARDAGPRRR
jgi:hypothetical protein